jgi:hypothetical protein
MSYLILYNIFNPTENRKAITFPLPPQHTHTIKVAVRKYGKSKELDYHHFRVFNSDGSGVVLQATAGLGPAIFSTGSPMAPVLRCPKQTETAIH